MSHSEAQLIIDLKAVRRNWRRLQSTLSAGAICAAVTKANAYGLGATQVIPALYREGCRHFFVASVREGVEARNCLADDATIFVLNGLRPGAEAECLAFRLIPVLFTTEQFQRWRLLNASRSEPAPCAIKFDSGMTRLGIGLAELRALCGQPAQIQELNPIMLISHLACADEPDHPLNQQQLQLFNRAVGCMREAVPGMSTSLANSSGIFLGPAWHADVARPGAALYGVNPVPGLASPVEPVVRLRLPIVQIRQVMGGEQVGYGATYTVPGPGRLAVTIGGYADGILRASGNKAQGFIGDIPVPLVGRVSMDSTVFDVTQVPESILANSDTEVCAIDLLGPHSGVDELAAAAGTIGYEILTSLGDRYSRHYLMD